MEEYGIIGIKSKLFFNNEKNQNSLILQRPKARLPPI